MNLEKMPEPNKGKEIPPQAPEMPAEFGEFGYTYEYNKETGKIEKIAPDRDVDVEKPKEKKEVPADVREAAEKFALEESWFARSGEVEIKKQDAYKKYLEEHGY